MEDSFNLEELNLESSTLDQIMNRITPEEDKTNLEDNTLTDKEVKDSNVQEDKDNNTENKTDTKEVKDKTPSSTKKEDSSTFSVFAKSLKEEGVISLDDEEVNNANSWDDVKELIRKQIETSRFENLSESQKRYLEAVEAGIPQKDFEAIEKQLNQLESITDDVLEENTQARFDLIAYDYIEKGISKEKAIELANRSIKLGTDKEDAKEALDSLKLLKAEEYKKTLLSKKEENKVSLETLKSTIESKDIILKDVKLTPKSKADLYNLLSLKVDTDEAGQPLNELNKWRRDNKLEAEIILGALYLQTNKFQNLGKILDTSKSKAALELERKLKQNEMSNITADSFTLGENKAFEINI